MGDFTKNFVGGTSSAIKWILFSKIDLLYVMIGLWFYEVGKGDIPLKLHMFLWMLVRITITEKE